tara:strand:- start:638 stop:970 length:333 start_codon:yes stop_codon:yes gene_type:complete
MYNLVFLRKENDLNKVLKKFKKEPTRCSILFISLWDKWCSKLVDDLKEKYPVSKDRAENVYIVDSLKMPHSFVIFGTNKTPHLIQLRRDQTISEDYLPNVYKFLKLNQAS